VYAVCIARTNIDIDAELIARVMKRFAFKTKREAVDYALRQIDIVPMTRDEVLAMRGSGWHGDHEEDERLEIERHRRLFGPSGYISLD
jgi:Arc/MetJ family transcription regulator